MRIGLVQSRPLRGDIAANLAAHLELGRRAAAHGCDLVVFPELSLTGYEPELAQELATTLDDPRFDVLQRLGDEQGSVLAVGMPTSTPTRPCISLAIFRPGRPRELYSKRYLHADEEPYFSAGSPSSGLLGTRPEVALAICYELSVPAHAAAALQNGAQIYLASVAKSAAGVEQASARLSGLSRVHHVSALMVNCIGPCGGFESAGRSAAWNHRGELVVELDGVGEGILVFDTEREVVEVVRD